MRDEVVYEQRLTRDERGRRSEKVRHEAIALSEIGREDQAFELFHQALAVFPDADDSVAAAAARFDLGEAYRQRRAGSRLENLTRSRSLLEAAP